MVVSNTDRIHSNGGEIKLLLAFLSSVLLDYADRNVLRKQYQSSRKAHGNTDRDNEKLQRANTAEWYLFKSSIDDYKNYDGKGYCGTVWFSLPVVCEFLGTDVNDIRRLATKISSSRRLRKKLDMEKLSRLLSDQYDVNTDKDIRRSLV